MLASQRSLAGSSPPTHTSNLARKKILILPVPLTRLKIRLELCTGAFKQVSINDRGNLDDDPFVLGLHSPAGFLYFSVRVVL